MDRETVGTVVLDFYRELPFNMFGDVAEQVAMIRSQDFIKQQFPVMVPYLRFGSRVIDVGCGTGWLANNVQAHFACAVTGIDFNPVAIGRAEETRNRAGLKTRFLVADVFRFEPEERFDVALSFGALHHTADCAAAVARVLQQILKPSGVTLIGLYHAFGRRPFLEHFAEMRKKGASESELFTRFRQLHSEVADDETLARSWFRDQVLHPHESQHTLEEMWSIVERAGGRIVSTSINDFNPIGDPKDLFSAEKRMADEARQALRNKRYFPGFFYFVAQAPDS